MVEEYLHNLGLNERQIKAVMYVKEKGKITNKKYQEEFAVSKATATRDLTELVVGHIIDIMGSGKRDLESNSGDIILNLQYVIRDCSRQDV